MPQPSELLDAGNGRSGAVKAKGATAADITAGRARGGTAIGFESEFDFPPLASFPPLGGRTHSGEQGAVERVPAPPAKSAKPAWGPAAGSANGGARGEGEEGREGSASLSASQTASPNARRRLAGGGETTSVPVSPSPSERAEAKGKAEAGKAEAVRLRN
ncbi:hypothetical protein T492DRAFT_849386 [Pavlovales sp. CCMP2436]|nr:hypothetical protein T492DRAFT_849386 [Pavlovales sp. CCMP2436]